MFFEKFKAGDPYAIMEFERLGKERIEQKESEESKGVHLEYPVVKKGEFEKFFKNLVRIPDGVEAPNLTNRNIGNSMLYMLRKEDWFEECDGLMGFNLDVDTLGNMIVFVATFLATFKDKPVKEVRIVSYYAQRIEYMVSVFDDYTDEPMAEVELEFLMPNKEYYPFDYNKHISHTFTGLEANYYD